MIYKLDEVSKKDVQEVGGKAANLGELIKLGFNVPRGFVCTAKENRDDIYNMYNKLKLDKVAVRSSAICEDGIQNSYAGQFETFLNIDKEEIIKSVEKCYESNRSENIKGYINEKDLLKIEGAGKEWENLCRPINVELQDKLGFIHPVTYRIYRNWDDLQEYQIIGISNARRVLEEK